MRRIVENKMVLVYGLAQLLNMLSILIIGKNYTSDQYGVYVLVSSFAGIVITLSNGKYHNNIISSNITHEKKLLVWVSLYTTISVNIICFIILYFAAVFTLKLNYLNTELLMLPATFWISLYCLIAGLNILTDSVLNSQQLYSRMSFGRLIKSLFFLVSIFIFKELGWRCLILSIFIGQLSQFTMNANILLKFITGTNPTKRELVSVAKKYIASPKYNIPLSLLISSSDYIFYSLIRHFWGINFLGNFSMAEKIIKIPVSLIGQPLAEIFFKKSADNFSSGQLDKLRHV